MMGDGTQEQNLGERGDPAARIKKKELVAAFGKKNSTNTKRSRRQLVEQHLRFFQIIAPDDRRVGLST